jgi:uncharacterized damage-inducible protein DinB
MFKLKLLAILVIAPILLAAQQKPAAPPAPAAPAMSPLRQEILFGFDLGAQEALALAKAVPEDKYSWRPMEGVRSFGEVFMHMAGSTLLFGSMTGMKIPDGPAHDLATVYMKRGFEMPELFAAEAAVKDKAKVLEIMEQSFQIGRDMIRNMPEADLEKPISFFGRPMTQRGLLIFMGNHLNQHVGQAIAYARVNHIVPPWSQPKPK